MEWKVLLFGPQAEIAGTRELTINTSNSTAKCEEILQAITEKVPELSQSIASSRLAINHAFATSDRTIQASDEIALIGMVSGG